ncbi:S-layer homology domain-containing protein [Sedimentibacter sp. B4]|uniref:InlB B-repeat-containing protein n=1 Tax=Sedimentibacter sp. B4 TaxID=304766 RepID=UPI0003169D9A|nr:S-layer homology domain-containing protein [Sedimentibacter sp. B4]
MTKNAKRRISLMLCALMIITLIPISSVPAAAEEVTGTAEMNALNALGIDTEEAPEGFDPTSTSNPYGRDHVTVNMVSEVLLTGSTKETLAATTTSSTITGIPNNEDDDATITTTTESTMTTYYINSTLYGDGYKTKGGNVAGIFATNKKELIKTSMGTEDVQNITIETTHTSPSAITTTTSSSITVLEPVDLSVVAASSTARGNFNGNEDGQEAQVAMVSTNKLAPDGGLYLSFGEYSDSLDSTYGYFGAPKVILSPSQYIGNGGGDGPKPISEDFANNPYLMQNYLKVSAGDYDNDGTDEVAVFVPSKGNSRIEIYKLKTKSLSSDSLEYFGNPLNWEAIWTYSLSEVDYVSNMVSLTSEDFNEDGVDDLAIAWGYYYGPNAKKGGTAAVLFGSESSMLQHSTTFPLRYGDTDIVRAAFTYGDVIGDGSGQLILGGQLNSDIEINNLNSRFIAVYNWDGTSFKQTMANNYDLYEKSTSGGTTTYKYANLGISGSYKFLSKPYCVSNMAVISRGLSEPAMLYFDSLQFTYGDDGLSLTGVLDRKTGASTDFAEYGAQSGDMIGLGYDTLFNMQCELPQIKAIEPSNFLDWIRYILYGTVHTVDVPAATYFNAIDYNKSSTFTSRLNVDHSTSLCLPNTDLDTSVLKYTGVHYFRYTDPKVLAVLASPPYFKDLLGRDDLSGSYGESETSYSSSEGGSDGVIGHASINAGVYASMEQDISVFGVKIGSVEAELAFHAEFTWETKYATELNQTIEFQTTPGEDTVALYSIPMEIYEYEATMLDSETGEFVTQVMSVNVPHIAAVTVMPVEKYNMIAENFNILQPVDKTILSHTLGEPSSYPSSADGYNDAVVYDGDWSAVGYTSTEGGTSIKQEIEMTSEWENSFELSVGMDYKSGAGLGGVVTGFTVGGEIGAGYVMVSTEGSTFSGSLQSMPSEAEEFGYYHVWKVFYYKYSNGEVEFPVVSYLVTDVSAPSPLPEDFEQDIEKTTDTQIALRWSYDKVVSGFQIYRYYEFPEGSGSYELPFVSMKDGEYDSNTGKWYFEFIDSGLSPYSDYSYQIQTVRSYVPVRSIKSEVETFRTKSDVGYPELSLYSTTDPGFNTAENERSLNIFPDSTNTVYTIVANRADYPEGVNYQWQKVVNGKWTDILGKNSSYITFSGSGESDEGTYRCRTNVIYYDSSRGDRYYISSYTESFNALYSKREPIVSDVGGFTAGVDASNIPVISLTLESANMNHRAAPTGNVVFNINGANYAKSYTVELKTSETRYSTAVLDGSIKNSAGLSVATALPEGVYEVTADYSGSRVFKTLSVKDEKAIPMLAGQEGYRLGLTKSGKAETTFMYGDIINGELIHYTRVDGATKGNVVSDGISFKIMKNGENGTWTDLCGNTTGLFDSPAVGSYRMLAIEILSGDILATREFTVMQKPVAIKLFGEKTSATGEVEQHLPVLSLAEGSSLAFSETLADLGLYIRYTNTAGNEVTMGNTSYSVTSIINGKTVTQTIAMKTPPGSYKATGAPVSNQTDLEKSTCANYNITFVTDTYIITGTKYEVKLTSIPVEGRTAGTLEIISPQVVSSTYGAGTSLTILARPYSGYAVKQWTARVISEAGNTVKTQTGGNTFSYTMKDEPIEIIVEYMIPDNTLTVNASPPEGGTVTWNDKYFTNGAKVSKNANIIFTAVPTANLYHFVKWQKVYGGLTTDIFDQTYSFTMGDYPTMLYAIFERDSYKLTLGDNLTAYYMYDHDEKSNTPMEKKYVNSGALVVGDTQVTVEPKVGYQVKSNATWKKDYVDTLSTGSSYSFIMLKDTRIDVETENLSYNVGFKLTEPAFANNKVSITVNGAKTLPDKLTGIEGGSKLVFSAEPAYKYIFKEWRVTLWPSTPEEKTTVYINPVLNIDALGANVNVEAVFIDNTKYVINAEVNSGGTHGKLCYVLNNGSEKDVLNNTVEVYKGDSLKIIAKPDDTYMVDKWYIDGVVLNTPEKEYLIENIDKVHEIKVDFKSKAYYKVDYGVNDPAMGQIITATSDGISFVSGNSDLGGGSKLMFTAKPADGYKVESWTVNNKIIQNKYGGNLIENVLSFALGENSSIVVNFVPITYHTVTKISPNAVITENYNFKTPEGNPWDKATGTFIVNPDSGYRITGLNAAGSTVSELIQPGDKNGSWNMVIGSITSDTTITAETKKIYQITAFANYGTINCVNNAVEGEVITLSAAPSSGYNFSEWSVSYMSGTETKKIDVTANKFVMVAADVSVSAVFEKSSDGFMGGGGGGAVLLPNEILIEDLQFAGGKVLVTLTDEKNIISEETNIKLIELNKTLSIVIEGNGFRIIIPKGALTDGDDVNDIVPDEMAISGYGWVVSYIDRFGSKKVVPWSIFSNGLFAFIAPAGGKYEVINNIQSFGDISGHWGEEQINFITSHNLFMGTGENNFSPDMKMNRAMLVTVLHRLDGLQNKRDVVFTDISEEQWYSDAVSWAASNNIVSGYSEGIFGPHDSITREQLATILYRYAIYLGLDTSSKGSITDFNDQDKISGYALDPMSWAVEKGLITGLPGKLLNPGGNATRAEVSAILMRFIDMVLK